MSTNRPAEWLLLTLGELTENLDSVRVPVKESERRRGPYPYYGASGIVDYVDGFLLDGEYLLIAEDGENLRTRQTPIAFIAKGKFWVNNHAHIVRGNEKANTRFLSYALANADISGYLTGSTMPKLTQGNMNRIRLLTPPRPTQLRIVEVLGSLDDKIELNRRINETLEALARRLFKSWFVDFDQVHAKAGLRREHPKLSNAELSRRALPNMAPEIAELFPDGFEDSTLGPIPKGWKSAKLMDHTEAVKGLSYKGSGLASVGVPMHNLNSVFEGGGYKFEGIKYYTGEYKDRHIVSPGEVIVANTEQGHDCLLLGYSAIVPRRFGNFGLFSHHTYRLRIKPRSSITSDYLSRLLNSPRMHDLVSGFGNGTTVNMLPVAGVEQPVFVVPSKPLIDAFSALAADIRRQYEDVTSENISLAKTRDRLLPQLLSGSIDLGAT